MPRLVAEPWYVDKVTIEGTRLAATGWSMPMARATEPPDGWFTVNGHRFDAIRYPLLRADVGEVFWQRAGSALSGFECAIDDLREPFPDGILEIRRVVPDTPAERGRDSWFKPDPAFHADLPDDDRRFRVIGDRDPVGIPDLRRDDYHRLDRVLLAVCGKHLHEFAPRARLGRGLRPGRPAFPIRKFTFVDRVRHRPRQRRMVQCAPRRIVPLASRLTPPLPFDDGCFDLVYGISVFTHFREAMQLRWLEELARVTARGAFLLDDDTRPDGDRLLPASPRTNIRRVQGGGEARGHPGERNELATRRSRRARGRVRERLSHSADYVRSTWGRFFDVEHIVPGYILHHDLVQCCARRDMRAGRFRRR